MIATMQLSAGQPRSGVFEYAGDPRIKYALFVPEPDAGGRSPGLLATVHSSERDFLACRDRFEVWARRHHQIVLSPLFPADLFGDGNADGYKVLSERHLRYDLIFNEMVDAVLQGAGCPSGRILLHGYSGGAQFAHRYWLLHPHRLAAVSLAAPGDVTPIDDAQDWPAGVRDVDECLGCRLDPRALRDVPVQLLVGDGDTSIDELSEASPSSFWPSELERRHAHRIARLRMFHASLASAGIDAQLRLMPGVRHGDGGPAATALAQAFFAGVAGRRPA